MQNKLLVLRVVPAGEEFKFNYDHEFDRVSKVCSFSLPCLSFAKCIHSGEVWALHSFVTIPLTATCTMQAFQFGDGKLGSSDCENEETSESETVATSKTPVEKPNASGSVSTKRAHSFPCIESLSVESFVSVCFRICLPRIGFLES